MTPDPIVELSDRHECVRCGRSMSIRDGREPQDDPELHVCDPCAQDLVAEMWSRLNNVDHPRIVVPFIADEAPLGTIVQIGRETRDGCPPTPEITPESGLSSNALLAMGLYVVETRARRRDKTLTEWKPLAGFIHHEMAEDFHEQYAEIGHSRILRPTSSDDGG